MRFDRTNPKFLMDLTSMILAMAIIVLTIIVIFDGSRTILAIAFYVGALLMILKMVRGVYVRKYHALVCIIPAAVCIAGGLMSEGIVPMPYFF